jgi:hypothetical protein
MRHNTTTRIQPKHARTNGIPQLDGLITGTRHNLRESNGISGYLNNRTRELTCRLSTLNATDSTSFECEMNWRVVSPTTTHYNNESTKKPTTSQQKHPPVERSHRRSVPSHEPDRAYWPSTDSVTSDLQGMAEMRREQCLIEYTKCGRCAQLNDSGDESGSTATRLNDA